MSRNNKVAECSLVWSNRKRTGQSITSPEAASKYLRGHWHKDITTRERFYLMCLSRTNELIGVSEMSVGGVHSCVVDLKLIFGTALKCLASGIIVAHNHPSGSVKPSNHDIDLTKKIDAACGLLDICFVDHIILSPDTYLSMREDNPSTFKS